MELNDNEFDATFRRKVFDADPQFEEAAWDKMEQRLKRRDRGIFFRKSALVLLALLAGLWGYYSFEGIPVKHTDLVSGKKREQADKAVVTDRIVSETGKTKEPAVTRNEHNARNGNKYAVAGSKEKESKEKKADIFMEKGWPVAKVNDEPGMPLPADTADKTLNKQLLASGLNMLPVPDRLALDGITMSGLGQQIRPVMTKKPGPVSNDRLAAKKMKVKRSLPVSLAISAGPEFNSASSVVGGDPGFNAGLTLGFGISKQLDLQAGVRYSIKKYSGAGGIRYNFPNTNGTWLKNNLTGLDATCDVLEIPLTASYQLADNSRRSINLNAGISSYLMLKEVYLFKYDNQYGAPARRTLQISNANQHLLSVAELSATYFIKLKNNNLKLGLEPFVKIPLSGVGEGNINLKSSGISLKLRYDLDKKND